MNRRDSSQAGRRTGEGDMDRTADDDPLGKGGWLDEEILKVLMGADVEFDPEDLWSTCVEEE
ncbi:hypothetical protein [Streptomyces sp. MUM 2J]|uniref:hypothetical protein n=1 Tax=Streptomyces sp. MUM 2J TaxID=2791987 RepID=UPI001F049D58|nr:hypothetical protein [Streptomyces sp. MUM 2J]MCH0562194.1 hypothetical protein [Streptomyces sp. MUM 2J]